MTEHILSFRERLRARRRAERTETTIPWTVTPEPARPPTARERNSRRPKPVCVDGSWIVVTDPKKTKEPKPITRSCKACHEEFRAPTPFDLYCSDVCRKATRAAEARDRRAKRIATRTTTCAICGTVFQPMRSDGRYCSDACQAKRWSLRDKSHRSAMEAERRHNAAMRVRKNGGNAGQADG